MAHHYNYTLGTTEYTSGKVTIYEHQRGLLYRSGRIERVLIVTPASLAATS